MRLAALFLFLALFAGLLGAQESTGSIIGRIFDPTGSAISGAEVTATQTETGNDAQGEVGQRRVVHFS